MMDRTIFLLMIFVLIVTYSNADYLNTKTSNQCVYGVQPYQNSKGLCYTKRSNNQSYCSSTLRYKDLIDGYEYVNSGCYLKNDLKLTGLSQEEWDYLLSILAHILGATMLVLINYLSISVVKNRG